MKKSLFFLLACLLTALPFIADACPMCQGGTTGGSIMAYRGTTIFLVLLPFISGWLIYRYIKQSMSEPVASAG